jgi:hypothetical protein
MINILELYPILFASSNLFAMLIPIKSDKYGTVFGEGGYSKSYFYVAMSFLIYSIIVYFINFGVLDRFYSFIFKKSIQYNMPNQPYR